MADFVHEEDIIITLAADYSFYDWDHLFGVYKAEVLKCDVIDECNLSPFVGWTEDGCSFQTALTESH